MHARSEQHGIATLNQSVMHSEPDVLLLHFMC